MPSLLVIGGSGFFGKSILSAYQRGILDPWSIDTVKIIARSANALKTTHPELLAGAPVELFDLDIVQSSSLPPADIVIHAATTTDATNYLLQTEQERNNIQAGTQNFCQLAMQTLRASKIVYVSSGAVYGKTPDTILKIPEDYSSVFVQRAADSRPDYATAKQESEVAIKRLGQAGVKVSIARCFAFLGEYLPRQSGFAIGNFIEDGLNNRPILVKAQHKVYRSYMHTDDLARWLLTIASHGDVSCPVYNVGSDQSIELKNLAQKIADYFGQQVESFAEVSEAIDRYIPDISLAQRLLSLEIDIALDEAIDLTVHKMMTLHTLTKRSA